MLTCTDIKRFRFISINYTSWGVINKTLRIRGPFVFFNFVQFLKNLRDFTNTNTNVRIWYSMLRSCFAVCVRQFGKDVLPNDIVKFGPVLL